jgi:hypothetical protein
MVSDKWTGDFGVVETPGHESKGVVPCLRRAHASKDPEMGINSASSLIGDLTQFGSTIGSLVGTRKLYGLVLQRNFREVPNWSLRKSKLSAPV